MVTTTMNMRTPQELLIRPEPEVISLDQAKFGGRKYVGIWARCLQIPGRRVCIRMGNPSHAQFLTIRKAVWKIKSEDIPNRSHWRMICERGKESDGDHDKIYFWIIPSDVMTRI